MDQPPLSPLHVGSNLLSLSLPQIYVPSSEIGPPHQSDLAHSMSHCSSLIPCAVILRGGLPGMTGSSGVLSPTPTATNCPALSSSFSGSLATFTLSVKLKGGLKRMRLKSIFPPNLVTWNFRGQSN